MYLTMISILQVANYDDKSYYLYLLDAMDCYFGVMKKQISWYKSGLIGPKIYVAIFLSYYSSRVRDRNEYHLLVGCANEVREKYRSGRGVMQSPTLTIAFSRCVKGHSQSSI